VRALELADALPEDANIKATWGDEDTGLLFIG